jgi:hypothetical protein
MFKSLSAKEIYDNSSLAFTFEFFTPLSKREAAAKLARGLGKKIKWFSEVDSGFEPTHEAFKIAPTYSNGYKEISISTGFLDYQEAIHMMLKTMHIIESIGYTTARCSVTTKIRLDSEQLGIPTRLSKLNKFKYLLGIDEKKLFELWPTPDNESQKIHRNHIHLIQPKNLYNMVISESFIERMDPVEFNFPESDFFASDFSELERGNLIVKYIGGKDYSKKKKDAVSAINLVIEHLYSTLSKNYEYSIEEKRKISEMVSDFKNSIDGTRNYFNFKRLYPNVSMYVDLRPTNFLVESHYTNLREKIFKLIVGGGIDDAVINYDTHRRALQIKDAVVKKSILIEGVEFYQCTVEADSKGCLFEGCTIKNSKLTDCTVFSNNFIKNSKLFDCEFLGESNEVSSSYLESSGNKTINADLRECLVLGGRFSLSSTVDKKTKILPKKG